VDLDIGIVAVGLSRQQRGYTFHFRFSGELFERCLGLADQLILFLDLGKLNQFDIFPEVLLDLAASGNRLVEIGSLAQSLPRQVRIVPKIGVFDSRV